MWPTGRQGSLLGTWPMSPPFPALGRRSQGSKGWAQRLLDCALPNRVIDVNGESNAKSEELLARLVRILIVRQACAMVQLSDAVPDFIGGRYEQQIGPT